MKAFICTACGKTSYSAAELENMIDSGCPYCGAKEDEDETLQRPQTRRTI